MDKKELIHFILAYFLFNFQRIIYFSKEKGLRAQLFPNIHVYHFMMEGHEFMLFIFPARILNFSQSLSLVENTKLKYETLSILIMLYVNPIFPFKKYGRNTRFNFLDLKLTKKIYLYLDICKLIVSSAIVTPKQKWTFHTKSLTQFL